ncbi:hypothetical protein EDB81DRAFT_915950 [Dactylonectria macrodidyma]|uniref:Uncharacterized protein n=1 Tax=Dactylonectria macrodidyma TaxID=307937 RepID=A0A9P9DDC6_9HYPO|nr:hypothetical protein EDB81DRAFT_915950 [Dactylonectria macrodidyma]
MMLIAAPLPPPARQSGGGSASIGTRPLSLPSPPASIFLSPGHLLRHPHLNSASTSSGNDATPSFKPKCFCYGHATAKRNLLFDDLILLHVVNPFRREEPPFIVDVAQYDGNYRGLADDLKCWEIRDPKQEPFNSILQAVCLEMSRCRTIPRSTLVLIDIFLRGETLESSAAYIMLSGATKRHRKTTMGHLRRSSLLQDYPGLKLDHWDWPPQAPNITTTGKKGKAPDKNLLYTCPKFDMPCPTTLSD